MNDVKHWWQSKTVVASVLTAICGLLTLFGVVGATKVAEEAGSIADSIVGLITFVLSFIAIYGRVTAKKEIQ